MALILLGSYMVRYPLGGMMSWVLQYLTGFHRLGHDVYLVEKSGYPNACYNPMLDILTDDCSYGVGIVDDLLKRFDLGGHWCYVDEGGEYHGLSRRKVEELFRSADLFVDMGTHGSWLEEASRTPRTVLLDGEPGFSQMKMAKRLEAGATLPEYDFYYTAGQNVGTHLSTTPVGSLHWGHVFHPVVADFYDALEDPARGAFTTVMNWQSYEPLEFRGRTFGHKDLEFAKFMDLPSKTAVTLEVAVSGKNVPTEELRSAGWRVADAHHVTRTYDSFVAYVAASRGEFGVCKNGFVATNSGWFSDRSAVYLAMGKPVVLEETGFSQHLPCGEGLFAAHDAEEAAAALDTVQTDYPRHAAAAQEIARQHLDAKHVLTNFLSEIGV